MTDLALIAPNVPEAEYHSGPQLSSTGAKSILKCPAQYRWDRTHYTRKAVFDKGTIAHRLILGAGPEVRVVDAYDWRTKAAQTARKQAEVDGVAVVHRGELREASRLRRLAYRDPDVSDIFTRPGAAEVSLYATDPDTGVRMRGRVDWLTESGDRACLVDVKTTAFDLHASEIARALGNFGYHQQAAWYLDLAEACGLPDPAFYFVFVPTGDPGPHHARVVDLPPQAIERGRKLNRRAIDLFKKCRDSGEWPCSCPTFKTIDLPAWAYVDKETDSWLDS